MPSVYPGAFDVLTNPTAASPLTAPSHAGQHIDENDAIEAIEATLGINPQGASATVAARFAALVSGAPIGSAVTGGTVGSILFVGTGPILAQDNANLFWDDPNNRLGIGNTNPINDVEVSRSGASSGVRISAFGTTFLPQLIGLQGRGTRASPTATQNGDVLFSFSANGIWGTSIADRDSGGYIDFIAQENWTVTQAGSKISLKTTPLGFTSTSAAERLGLSSTEIVINDPGLNVDFRVEGDTEPNLLFVDASTDNVGIGTATPGGRLDVVKNGPAAATMQLLNNNAGVAAQTQFVLGEDGASGKYATFEYLNSGFPTAGLQTANQAKFVSQGGASAGWLFSTLHATAPIVFAQSGIAAANERLRIGAAEIVFNDNGQNVDFRVEGDAVTNLLIVDASADRVGIGVSVPAHRLETRFDQNGASYVASTNTTNGTAAIAGFYANNGTKGFSAQYRAAAYTGSANTADSAMMRSDSAVTGGFIVAAGYSGTGVSPPVLIGIDDGGGLNGFEELIRITLNDDSPLSGQVVFNENGENFDLRVEGDTNVNLFFADASTDRIGMGTAAPTEVLEINRATGDVGVGIIAEAAASSAYLYVSADSLAQFIQLLADSTNGNVELSMNPSGSGVAKIVNGSGIGNIEIQGAAGTETVINQDGVNVDFRVESDTQTHLLFVDASVNFLGVRNSAPLSGLDVDASVGFDVTSTSATTFTLDSTHHTLLAAASGGAITVNLPAASGVTRRRYEVMKVDASANNVTVDANGAETINGIATYAFTSQYQAAIFVCNGTEWFVIADS